MFCRRLIHPLFLILLLFGCSCERVREKPAASGGETLPPKPDSSYAVPEFSGARAFSHLLKQTSFGPRNPNSEGHRLCLAYLFEELRKTGAVVQSQEFTHPGYDGVELSLTNVIASFQPQLRERVLLCAHWDTRPRADQDEHPDQRNKPIIGANDGASGVAVLLEVAHLLSDARAPVGVDIVLFDGEDYGREGDLENYLLGSKHFALNISPDSLPKFGILLDMVGDEFLELPREANSVKYAPDIVDRVWNTAKQLGYPEFLDQPGTAVFDDHLPLNEIGIKTIDIIDFNYPDRTNRYWHTLEDTPAHCSAQSLQAVGTVLTHIIYTGNR